ncbi:Pet127-domain-containing protein [Biscogniauxia marginata]|nr:Pet127-domain-containing protein [Biscogniauxia marginata]
MLQLGSRSASRLGASYICASCLSVSHSSSFNHRAVVLSAQHGQPFSTTSHQAAATTPSDNTSTDADAVGKGEIPSLPPQQPASKKAKKKASKKASAKLPPLNAPDPTTDTQRQLNVLQGALEALKNVLAAKNIDVSQIVKLNQLPEALEATEPKSKTKSKKAAEAKKASETDKQETPSAATKKESKKSAKKAAKLKDSSGKAAEAVAKAPKSPKATAGRKKPLSAKARRAQAKKDALAAKQAETSRSKQEADLDIVDEDEALVSTETQAYKVVGNPFTGVSPTPEIIAEFEGSKKKTKKKEKKKAAPLAISTIDPKTMHLIPIETGALDVPALSYGLERVLFNPGVYQLQDPRSRVYNFDPYLSEIMPIQEFDFNALKQYVTSSKDTNLISIAKENQKKYTGSTSSMTSMLAHFHYLLSSWREVNTQMLSQEFEPESRRFTKIMRAPAAAFLHWKDGTYAIDADKEFDSANILSMLGKSMEKLLTLSKEDYERYRHTNSDQITEEERNAEEAFHYTSFLDFMMRSQLDARDARIPGTGMFDLKTRAVISIRMDAKGFQKGLGYEIRKRFGQWESFEREYFDMIRSAFLKYSLQVRMGRMDGIFVAFHNTERIFGFQYIPLTEMDLALHGTSNTVLGHREFKLSLKLFNDLLNRATEKFPEQSLRLHVETRPSTVAPYMYIFAEPVKDGEVAAVQNAQRASIDAFEREILGLVKNNAKSEPELAVENDDALDDEADVEKPAVDEEMSSLSAWEEARQMVEDAMNDDELGVGTVREAIEDALEQSGLLRARSSAEAQQYVDALLAAITDSHPSELARSSSTQSEDQDVCEDEYESAADASSSESANATSQESETAPQDETAASQESGLHLSEDTEKTRDDPVESTQPGLSSQDDQQVDHALQDSTDQEQNNMTSASETEQSSAILEPENPSLVDAATSTEQSNAAIPEESEKDKDDEADVVDADADDAEPGDEIESTPSMSPLKDLIMRMAQKIDQKPILEDDAETSAEDSSKLKSFERILGELISLSKDEQIQAQSSDPESESGVEPKPDSQDDVQSTKSQADEPIFSQQESVQKLAKHASEVLSEEMEDIPSGPSGPLLGMVLTIKNKVNGRYVTRPSRLVKGDEWTVEYNIEELEEGRARTIYKQCRDRRRKIFEDTGDRDKEWYQMFQGKLDELTQRGRKFRALQIEQAQKHPVHVMGFHEPLKWEDVFGKPMTQDSEIADNDKREDDTAETE